MCKINLKNVLFAIALTISMFSCNKSEEISGDKYYEAGEYSKAISAYSEDLKLNPSNKNLLYNRGRAYMELEEYDKALEDFKATIKVDDRHTSALVSLGDVMYEQGEFDKALFYYEQAADLQNRDAKILLKEARANHKLSKFDEALAGYNKAITENPDLGEAYLYRGALKASQKKTKEACNDFQKAKSLNMAEADKAIAKYCN